MKELTLEQASRALRDSARNLRPSTPAQQDLVTRIDQYTAAVERAISNLQEQLKALQKPTR